MNRRQFLIGTLGGLSIATSVSCDPIHAGQENDQTRHSKEIDNTTNLGKLRLLNATVLPWIIETIAYFRSRAQSSLSGTKEIECYRNVQRLRRKMCMIKVSGIFDGAVSGNAEILIRSLASNVFIEIVNNCWLMLIEKKEGIKSEEIEGMPNDD